MASQVANIRMGPCFYLHGILTDAECPTVPEKPWPEDNDNTYHQMLRGAPHVTYPVRPLSKNKLAIYLYFESSLSQLFHP